MTFYLPFWLLAVDTGNVPCLQTGRGAAVVGVISKKPSLLSQAHARIFLKLTNLNLVSIETIVYYRKLQFFGQMCRLPSRYLAKLIFFTDY